MTNKTNKDFLPSLKTLSVISFILFLCGAVLFPFEDGGIMTYIREYAGLFWHISMFFFISKLPTPEWGRKAGTFWVLIDVVSGLLYLNNFYGLVGDAGLGIAVQTGLTLPYVVRLAAHIFEGIWLVSSAFTTDNKTIKVCGVLAGVLIGGYSIVSPFAPSWCLALNMPFMLVWFVLIVLGKYEKREVAGQ